MTIRAGLFVLFFGAVASSVALAQPPGMGGEDRKILKQFDSDESGWLNQAERKEAREFLKENPSERRGPGGPGGRGGFGGPGGPGFGGPGGPGFGGPGFGGGPPGGPGFGPPSDDEGEGRGRGRGDRGDRGRGDGGRGDGERGDGERGERGPDFGGGPGFGPPGGRGGFGGPGGFGGRGGPGGGRGRGGPGGPGGRGGVRPEATEGIQVEKDSVQPQAGDLYDANVLRTVFIDFENTDWESELEDFHGTDVDVPATVTVDGKSHEGVGIHFRGASSYGMVQAGHKRSLNLSVDMVDDDQKLLGYNTLNLLNGSSDDSMLSTVLYSHIARQHIPAPKANFVRVVINGENWGVYTNVQQFNKDFLKENYDSKKGARWKVSGSPRGGGGLDYRGDDPENYQDPYEQKSGGKKSLEKLIELCRVMDETPAEELPAALEPICDVDGLLWFLALDNGLINSDGYWVRASDYSIYLDKDDVFHFIPHDMNEAFRAAGGPGRGRGSSGGSPLELDPLVGMTDVDKPLRSKVLAVPKYRQQYLSNVRQLAQQSLDWNELGPVVERFASLIDSAVKEGTRKLGTYEAFKSATSGDGDSKEGSQAQGGHGAMNLKTFADLRRDYLVKKTEPADASE